jgi:hypothetical protein
MVMFDIAENSLDGLADECDHAPHKFHYISSRQAPSSVAGALLNNFPAGPAAVAGT